MASAATASSTEAATRESYEGAGGWRDGRLGQAYDHVYAALKTRGVRRVDHPLLKGIEALDSADSVITCPHAGPFAYCDGCKVLPCPVGLS